MASDDEKALKSSLFVHLDFIREFIKKTEISENSRNRGCGERLRFVLGLIVGDQVLSCNEIIEIDKTIKILKKHHAENENIEKSGEGMSQEQINKSKSNEACLIQMLYLKKRKTTCLNNNQTAKRIRGETGQLQEPCTSSSVLKVARSEIIPTENLTHEPECIIKEEPCPPPTVLEVARDEVPPKESLTNVSEPECIIKEEPSTENIDCISSYNLEDYNKFKLLIEPLDTQTLPVKKALDPKKEIGQGINFLHVAKTERVCNMSYQRYNKGFQFICHLRPCNNEVGRFNDIMFNAHFKTKHPNLKWDGYCISCKRIVSEPGSLTNELEHLKKVHLGSEFDTYNTNSTLNTRQQQQKIMRDLAIQKIKKTQCIELEIDFEMQIDKDIFEKNAEMEKEIENYEVMQIKEEEIEEDEIVTYINQLEDSNSSTSSETEVQLKIVDVSSIKNEPNTEFDEINDETTIFEEEITEFDEVEEEIATPVKEEKVEDPDVVEVIEINDLDVTIKEEESYAGCYNKQFNSQHFNGKNMFETTVLNPPMVKKPGTIIETYVKTSPFKTKTIHTVTKTNFKSAPRMVVITKSMGASKDTSATSIKQQLPSVPIGPQNQRTFTIGRTGQNPCSLIIGKVQQRPGTTISQIASDDKELDERMKLIYTIPRSLVPKDNTLRPWLKVNDFKLKYLVDSMLKFTCLKNFYKCMHPTCNFHTNEKKLFSQHLTQHVGNHKCCYCLFEGDSNNLKLHIWNTHWMCDFACSLCFYRGIDRFLVYQHMAKYHSDARDKIILYLKPGRNNEEDSNIDMVWALEQREKLVKPIKCTNFMNGVSECTVKIYDHEKFATHQRLHHSSPNRPTTNYRCLPCNDFIPLSKLQQHLIDHHNIKRFHCLWCSFSAQFLSDLRNHLTDEHPNQPPIYCDRAGCKTNVNQTSVKATDIFKFKYYHLKYQLSIVKIT